MVWNGPEGDRIAADAGLTPANPVLPTGAAAVNRAGTALADGMTLDEYGAILERRRLLIGLLAELIRLRDGHDAGARQRQLDAAMRLIEAGRNRPPTVAALAAAARLSPTQLRRLFLRHTGRPPAAFVTAQRMARAQALLARGVSIKEAAVLTGYADVFHFMRVFRHTVGETAGRFARASGPGRSLGPKPKGLLP